MQRSINAAVNDYTEIVRRLSFGQRLAYGVGHVLNDICASMWFTYLLVFFHLVLEFDAFYSGVILLIGQIADAVATPFVGFHSDKHDDFWLCRYGKRKTWHLFGTICVLLAFPFIFSSCINCETAHQWAQLIYYASFVIIFQFGWAAVQISHLSLIPDLTPTEQERTELTALRYSFTVFSNILVYCIAWAVLHVTNDVPGSQIGPTDVHKFQKVLFIGLGVGFGTSLIFHIFVKETAANNSGGLLRQSTRSVTSILKDAQMYQVALVYMPTRLFVNLSQIYVPLYLHETLHMAATSLAVIPLTIFLSSFMTSLIIERLNTRLGRKISYFIGVVVALCACVCIWLGQGSAYVTYEIYLVAILLGMGGSIMLVTSLGVTADFIGFCSDTGAFVYGVMSFSDKLCNGLAVIVIQSVRCTSNCSSYYRDVIAFVCGAAALFGLLVIIFIKPFTYNDGFNNLYYENSMDYPPISAITTDETSNDVTSPTRQDISD
ncbi:major facilitator superfamily domain-containing protein 12 [Orussus abietinus]|uniref:major facilitator superfamily domain-containing protein 12 n=1 Tax=Orussus abietinus TaxID=222816 RepID=UPI000626596D|nr:major facilitator superfamily domain-containing protein 12 [Orussus abietinus]XP_012277991.1 major facilitator superfamily domain-containing protein 12 [Orussus abietinus]XP_012277992.1 major facilitator superfamily domain-containing protein 12 [Orussus abietinus]XP_012277994.1 major facilitator superfamily domain-containing protein 12 [Orussus abietinus]